MTLASLDVCQSPEETVELIHAQPRPGQHAPEVIQKL